MTDHHSPTVSVVIPCYNAQATVAETVESALAQTVPVQVIAVNDGSTDRTAEVLHGLQPRITVLSGPNQGVSAARNWGMSLANGAFIQFLDSDDLLTPDAIQVRLKAAEESGADVVFSGWQEFRSLDGVYEPGRIRHVDANAIAADPELAFATDVWAPPAAVLYRRRIVEAVGGFNPRLPVIQDARHLFDAAYQGAAFVCTDHLGARYRVVADSLSRSNNARFARDLLVNTLEIAELWRAKGSMSEDRRRTVMKMLNMAGRSLFEAGDADYFSAIASQRALGLPLPMHSRLAPALAQAVGVKHASRLLRLFGK